MVPRAVLMKSGLVSLNAARQVNTAHLKTTMNVARPMSYLSKKAHSTVKRPIHKNTADKGVIDSGCSRHMTGNMSYFTDYEEIDGGYVAFGWNPKGGKIIGKGTIKTGTLDFENVYFVRELKFNLFSVSQMCDKKNSVLFNDTECIVLSPNFKLIDESQVLLRVPRKNNMYSVDLKNIVPKGGLTCLFAKATLDESKLWHRRLGHLNFKTMNKLVKGNLNRVLVVKPHNKTLYELFHGRTPTLSFMRPFGCPVTILNTIDHLGKFDGKADEGFFGGYSLNSKAFRVFNSRTRIVEENLHIRFSENTPKVVGSGTDWLFDIDAQTRTINYETIVTGTRSNGFAGTKANENASQARKETEPVKDYILLPLWTTDTPFSQDPKSSKGDESIPSSDEIQEKIVNKDIIIFDSSRDDEDDGGEVNMNNLDTTIQVSPNPTTRIHKDHPLDQVIGDLKSATQTRRMSKNLEEHRLKKHCMDYIKLLELGMKPCQHICWTMGLKEGKLTRPYSSKGTKMSSMGELTFFLGLQVQQKKDGIFISQDKYVGEILKKFRFTEVKTASTPMETQKPLLKDEDGKEVDVHMYRSMIGSLMYLTSSRPDIMFAVCVCARYQVNPKVSHLHAVKRIFRYLKGQPKLGLWYPKDSPFDLVAYTDSDYARASLDRKSTIGGCQFLGCRLISWQCKKQTMVANSTTEAEYVAASSCCRQVLWIQNQLLDYGYNFMHTKIFINNNSTICIIKNPIFHSKTKHIEIRHHFIRDCNEKKLIQMVKIHTDKNVADLLTKAFDVSRFQYLIVSIGMMNL
ncbi:putative ribonuclease H-like domain-containing protein [Tanacetum coccineum]